MKVRFSYGTDEDALTRAIAFALAAPPIHALDKTEAAAARKTPDAAKKIEENANAHS